jgi:hypothetical protein
MYFSYACPEFHVDKPVSSSIFRSARDQVHFQNNKYKKMFQGVRRGLQSMQKAWFK